MRGIVGTGISTTPGTIHLGGNSGFAMLGLALQFGARRIILLGYDMQRTGGRSHWHGDHRSPLKQAQQHVMHGWVRRFDIAAKQIAALGVEVINATQQSALKCFPRVPLEEALYASR